MLGLPHLKVGRAGNRRTRLNEVGRIELLGAVFALVTARAFISACGAGAFDIPVGQESIVRSGIELVFGDFLDQAGLGEPSREMLCQPVVLLTRRPAVLVEREAESVRKILLDGPHFRAIFGNRLARPIRREFRGSAMLVGGAEEEDFVSPGAHVAGIQVRRKL